MFVHCSERFAPYVPNTKNSHLLHESCILLKNIFTFYFLLYCQTSLNEMFLEIISLVLLFIFSKWKDISFFAFLRTSLFYLLRFSIKHDPFLPICKNMKLALREKVIHLVIKNLLLKMMHFPVGIYLFKVNNRNTRIISKIC